MPLDPQAQDFLSRLAAAKLPSIEEQTVEQARARWTCSTRFLGKPPHVRSGRGSDDRRAGRRSRDPVDHAGRCRAGAAADRRLLPRRRLGAGRPQLSRGRLPGLANASKAIVASVDYRLAPEHPFPAAADDAYAALAWISAHAAEIGGDASRIAVCGDSAGRQPGGRRDPHGARSQAAPPSPSRLLAYPITDYDPDAGSYLEFAEGYFLTRDEMLWYWDQYVPEPRGPTPAVRLAEPRRRPVEPSPALVVTAEYDVLRDEGEAVCAGLAEAGVPVKLSRYDGMIHGFLRRYPFFDQGRAAIDEIGAALREAFEVKALRSDAAAGG